MSLDTSCSLAVLCTALLRGRPRLRPRWPSGAGLSGTWFLAPAGETRLPTAVVMRYAILRFSGSGVGSGRGAKFDSTRLGRGWQCDAHQLNSAELFPVFKRGDAEGEALLAGLPRLSQQGRLSALGLWPSSTSSSLVPSGRGALWVNYCYYNYDDCDDNNDYTCYNSYNNNNYNNTSRFPQALLLIG